LIEHDLFAKTAAHFSGSCFSDPFGRSPSRRPEQSISRNPSRPDGMTLNE